jgi:glyoxylase-like metal-dependent hydrolase (beta-lactamase superfamily II)
MMRRRVVLSAGVGAFAVGGAMARADDPMAESDPAGAMKRAGDFFKAPASATKLTENLSLITGPGGNMAVLAGPDGLLLVDSGLAPREADVIEAVERAGGKPVAMLINTHWHMDHAGNNAAFARRGARIVATANARKRLSTDQDIPAFKMHVPASPPEAWPVLTTDEAELFFNGEEIALTAVPPAHTDGDLVIHFRKADVIHAGDLITSTAFPNIDASSLGWIGGMIAAADRLLKLAGPGTRIIPGHGRLATADDLRAYRAMLAGIYDKVAPMADAGRSMEDVVRARPTADFDGHWGGGILTGPMFARLVYDGLVKHREEGRKASS